jgi:hypothetical protein
MKNAVFWDVLILRIMLRLLVTVNVVPSSPILVTLMMEVTLPSETSALQESHNLQGDGILAS